VCAGASVKFTETFVKGAVKPETVNVTSRLAPKEVQAAGPSGMAPKVPAFAANVACGAASSAAALIVLLSAPNHNIDMAKLNIVTQLNTARVVVLSIKNSLLIFLLFLKRI
jgi:hypothetical protein